MEFKDHKSTQMMQNLGLYW